MEEKVGDIFLELASTLRLEILLKLSERKARLSELAREFNITSQEAHRNVERLMSVGLVDRNHDGLISLTGFGFAILAQISGFRFLIKHGPYFAEHITGDLPPSLVHRLGELYDGQLINGVVRVFEKWKQIVDDADEYVKAVKATVSLEMIVKMAEAARVGVKYSYVLAEDAIVPKGRTELHRKLGWQKLITEGLIERRMVKKVQVVTIMNEKQASLLFPDLKGKADFNSMFYSEDQRFHEWCLDYFRQMWSTSGDFDEGKIKEA